MTNKNAIVFNPAPVNLKAYDLNSSHYTAELTSYVVGGEMLYTLFGKIEVGKTVYLPMQHPIKKIHLLLGTLGTAYTTNQMIANHRMSSVKAALAQYQGR
ncbi:hypothetical protein [Paenibacillus alvei]|uniref:hypothetical protein n=1 Tax=Paenibacillus alvei TaxID=44250 RepID=UPI0018CE07CB|nr:hypothetical protein [Paenibacillus alvei]MCY9581743.1 hypothetical protein [Paenibacillus alvei]MCY9588350.1 hypothetical protein [Paenibacillus alvei]